MTKTRIVVGVSAAAVGAVATAAHLAVTLRWWPEAAPAAVPLTVLALAGAAVWPLSLLPAAAAVNAALLVLPSYILITPPGAVPPFGIGWLRLGGFMDAPTLSTPLLFAGRTAAGAATGGASYLENPLATVAIAAVTATAFARTVAALWGREAAVVALAALVSDRWFLKLALTGNNAGTLLLPSAMAAWSLAIAMTAAPTVSSGLRAGALAAMAVITSLYAYMPARIAANGIAACTACWGAGAAWWRGAAARYCGGLALPSVVLVGVLLLSGAWNTSVVNAFGFRPSAPRIDARPESMDIMATVGPDIPLWFGQTGSAYWRRPPGELAVVAAAHWSRVWENAVAGHFPGERYAAALFLLGACVALYRGWRGFLVLVIWLAACAAPYLLVASLRDVRRGAAVVMPFAAGVGVGALWLAAWLPRVARVPSRWRGWAAAGLAVLVFACVRWPREMAAVSDLGGPTVITVCAGDPPVHALALDPRTRGRRAIFVQQGPPGPCVTVALHTAEVRRALSEPLARAVYSARALDEAADALGRDEYLALDCRPEMRRVNAALCDAALLRGALVVPGTAWPEPDTAWLVIGARQ